MKFCEFHDLGKRETREADRRRGGHDRDTGTLAFENRIDPAARQFGHAAHFRRLRRGA